MLDTNIVLYLLNGNDDLNTFLDNQYLIISIITEMELLSFASFSKQELSSLKNFVNQLEVIPLNEKVKDIAVAIRQKYKLKLPDSIVAATSIALDIPLITADKQFRVIKDLQLLIYDLNK